ncbi:sensor domain-containing diguanylate cyclase [Denitratisoma oestradiolicum]|uniref:Diguanylate cyclase n=1 Tax=Denitratisoma oestradiolicum TaxID=311182 RepID=A0A6S6XN63_9PROT|nr:diguanylate cyclase [Denitratisoma oestradiolicum]TWO80887.1 hypothetical protein CBW56_06955 [Denitratisoma oestradiolicum]CAB1367351.1 conserved protein of unknown function [Denitratisoma oestradiolicum]
MQKNRYPLLVLISSVLLAATFLSIALVRQGKDQQEFEQHLANDGRQAQAAFQIAAANQELQLLTLAALVANSPRVAALFAQGREAVLAEGGGPGQSRSAEARAALMREVEPAWRVLQQQFGLRQLHFFLAPGALSYLRVHHPDKFGDRIDDVRPIIVDVNRDQRPRSGFETGRLYSALRGVVPVLLSRPGGNPMTVGAVEAGGSFEPILSLLDRQLDAGLAVTVDSTHVEGTVWNTNLPNAGEKFPGCDCYLEITSRPEIRAWLTQGLLPDQKTGLSSRLLEWKDHSYHMLRFPLRDYLGTLDLKRPTVGSVLIWSDISRQVANERNKAWRNWGFNFLAYLVAQAVLLLLLQYFRKEWQRRLDAAKEAVSVREQSLDLALKGADLGTWDWHVPSSRVEFNERWARMLGYRPDELEGNLETWSRLVHPDDWLALNAVLEPHLRGDTPAYESEHRMRHKDGHWVWVLDRGRVVERDAVGQPLRAAGTHLDITARRDALAAAEASRREVEHLSRRNELLLMSAGEGIFGLDVRGRITFINPAALSMLGYGSAEVIGQDSHALLHPRRQDGTAYPEAECPIFRTLHDGMTRHTEDWLIRKDGQGFPVELTTTAMKEQGTIEGAVTVFQNIEVRRQAEAEMIRLATIDSLTGLLNRRCFLEQAEKEMARVRRFNQGAALLMLDLDFFKRVNDTHGHAAGDGVLRHFATLSRDSLRQVDLFGRLGGEEFGILLPATDEVGARETAERLRGRLEGHPAEFQGITIAVTVSIGLTLLSAADASLDIVINRADAALYRAKHQGRNRVEAVI